MIKWINNKFNQAFNKQVDGLGLAIWRICFAFVLLLEIFHYYYFREIIFEFSTGIILIAWSIVLTMIILGLFTRIAAIISYLICLFLIPNQTLHYHMEIIYFGTSLFFIFFPVSRRLSLDRLIQKLKYSSSKYQFSPPSTVRWIYYLIPLFLILGVEYFESAANWKIISPVWLNGLGVWLPASIPNFIHVNLGPILNFKYFFIFLSYLTLMFELGFIFLFWFKIWRIPLLIIGIGLHIGILILFPIPLFALGMISYYILLISPSFIIKLNKHIVKEYPSLNFYYDANCPLCIRIKIIIDHFDIINAIAFTKIQSLNEDHELRKMYSMNILLNDVFSISKCGRIYSRVDTYVQVFIKMRYPILLGLFIKLPGIYCFTNYIYQLLVHNRSVEYCTDENCGFLPSQLLNENFQLKLFNNINFDDLKAILLKLWISLFLLTQLFVSAHFGLFGKTLKNLGMYNSSKYFSEKSKLYPPPKLVGIGTHPLYMDYSFVGYQLQVAFKEINGNIMYLPAYRKDGLIGRYLYGPNYIYNFYVVNQNKIERPNILIESFSTDVFNDRINPIITFWIRDINLDTSKGTFYLHGRKYPSTESWQSDYLKNCINTPFIEIGAFRLNQEDQYKLDLYENDIIIEQEIIVL